MASREPSPPADWPARNRPPPAACRSPSPAPCPPWRGAGCGRGGRRRRWGTHRATRERGPFSRHSLHASVVSHSLLFLFAPEARVKTFFAYSTVRLRPGISPRRRPASVFSQSQAKLGLGVSLGLRKWLSSVE